MKKKHTSGFTLIEMLVVITIIAILAGLSFGLMNVAGRNAKRAEVRGHLERLASAIEEFYSEYGHYPPVETSGNTSVPFMRPSPDIDGSNQNPPANYQEHVLQFGLLSFLIARRGTLTDDTGFGIPEFILKDIPEERERALRMKNHARPHLLGIVKDDAEFVVHQQGFNASGVFTNSVFTIKDRNHDASKFSRYRYESPPPHTSYTLWWEGDGMIIYAGKDADNN